MNNIFVYIQQLTPDIIDLIKEYTPKKYFVFTNRENYTTFHIHIKKYIKNYNNYIRDIIRRDNEFVFNLIVRENIKKWSEIKQYKYKNMIFQKFLYFINYYCLENDSNNCKNIINIFLKEDGLDKNLHKKNIIKYIRWKN
jgi:c-di-AMP phosphodiesterase-like protein